METLQTSNSPPGTRVRVLPSAVAAPAGVQRPPPPVPSLPNFPKAEPPKPPSKPLPPPVPSRPQHTLSIYSTDIPKPPSDSMTLRGDWISSLVGPTVGVEKGVERMNLDGKPVVPPLPTLPPPKIPLRKEPPPTPGSTKPIGEPSTSNEELAPAQRRPTKAKSTENFVDRLRAVVNPEDPTTIYRSFVKIGQGYQ